MKTGQGSRRQQILEVLARELEVRPGSPITTAALARAVGVSEAALYRHFPSKTRMFDELIAFAEDTVFERITRILDEYSDPLTRCQQILYLVLGFAARNPGICRVLSGDALVGESDQLRARVGKFFDRLETQLKQVLREDNLRPGRPARASINGDAVLMMAVIEGQLARYVRSDFRMSPVREWEDIWTALARALFPP
jgi:TetR/AcrR family transcriptional regulator